jgi:hypothetical protein
MELDAPSRQATQARLDTGEIEMVAEPADDSEVIVADQFALGVAMASQSTSESGATRMGGQHDAAVERWIAAREECLIGIDDAGKVRLAASTRPRQLDDLLGDNLQLRLQLHRLPTYALITLSVGTTRAFAGELPDLDPFCFQVDVGDDGERAAIEALGREFTFALDLYDADHSPVRRRTVSAAFAENARVAFAAALEHLSTIPSHRRSFAKAVLAYSAPDYDRFGRNHPERRAFRDDRLQQLSAVSQVRRALAMVRRFSTPENEDYLFFQRGYPLSLWRERRRAVVQRAVELGLWIGPELVNITLSEGIARSRRDLAKSLQRNFAHLVSDPSQHDLNEEAVRENWSALREEMVALGLDPDEGIRPRTEPIDSKASEVASGTIGLPGARPPSDAPMSYATPHMAGSNGGATELRRSESLLLMLDDKDTRLAAALELAGRTDTRAIAPMFDSIKRMSRGEAGRVLGAVVRFGKPAVPFLLQALHSRKGYLRQGAALALAVLKDEEGIEAICDLLVTEPTEIWREIARAIGEVGPGAVMSLAARLANQSAEVRERAAWALAHVAARGFVQPIEQLARGRDPIAAGVARRALELAELARTDNTTVRGEQAPRDQTVNRAFSRRFFEALEGGPRAGMSLETGNGAVSQAMELDEADLLEAMELDDAAEALDESDLLPS